MNELTQAIESFKANGVLRSSDESSIKNGVILRVFSLLTWDIFNVDEVKPECVVGSRRVDYSLCIFNENKVFIEVKRPSENLENHQEQLLDYSFREGIQLAVLTNGLTWWFYLPLMEGNWEQRRFYTIDFLEQEASGAAERLIDFLLKENIQSGKAFKKAKEVFKSTQKKRVLKETLPKAWEKIVSEPDDSFVNLMIETTERLSGFRPEIEDIEKFLKSDFIKFPSVIRTIPRERPSQRLSPEILNTESNLTDDYINRRPARFTLFGREYYPKTWQEILLTVAEKLYRDHSSEFEKCLTLKGTKMAYFSKNKNELRYPKSICNSDYYFEAKLNANSIVKRCHELLRLFGHHNSALEIVIQ